MIQVNKACTNYSEHILSNSLTERNTFNWVSVSAYSFTSAGIIEQSMGAGPVGIELSYRPARLRRLAESISLESIPGLLKSLKIPAQMFFFRKQRRKRGERGRKTVESCIMHDSCIDPLPPPPRHCQSHRLNRGRLLVWCRC